MTGQKLLLQCLFIAALFTNSCSRIYTPKSPDTFVFTEDDHAHLSVAYNVGNILTDNTITATAGISPFKHFSVTADAEYDRGEYYLGGNIGYYGKTKKNGWFNIKVGGGIGTIEWETKFFRGEGNLQNAQGSYKRYFLQSTYMWQKKKWARGWGWSINSNHFYNYKYSIGYKEYYPDYAHNFNFINTQFFYFTKRDFGRNISFTTFLAFNPKPKILITPNNSPLQWDYFDHNIFTTNFSLCFKF